jgi:phospholipase C
MSRSDRPFRILKTCRVGLSALAMAQFTLAPALAETGQPPYPNDSRTTSPIKHVIIILGENRSFDHVFATLPPPPGQTINNLLSEGIVTLDANKNAIPGPNFSKAHQLAAQDLGSTDAFLLNPPKQEFPGDLLPAPLVGGPEFSHFQKTSTGKTPAEDTGCKSFVSLLACVEASETGLPTNDYSMLLTGGFGNALFDAEQKNPLFPGESSAIPPAEFTLVPDARIFNVNNLPAGPFQLTNGTNGTAFTYDSYAGSPVHRFYQMAQQLNCSETFASLSDFLKNPSGCTGNLFAWVEATVGSGTNGLAQPANFVADNFAANPTASNSGEGSTALGFYNVQQGDVPYFTSLAQQYGLSDNFHQPVMGGTGVNHIMLGHADMLFFSDGNGNAAVPPDGVEVFTSNIDAGVVHEIENPNPQAGTNNWYTEDGFGESFNAGFPASEAGNAVESAVYGGGSYSNCSDPAQPGVKPVLDYLQALPLPINPHCEAGHYYLLNNYNPGYFGDGSNAFTDNTISNTPFTIPPSTTPSIGDDLNAHNISWKYYGDQWNNFLNDKYQINFGTPGPNADEYCNICNPFQYDTSIMTDPVQIATHLQDLTPPNPPIAGQTGLYADITGGTLPAVSIVKPSGYVDGHPSSSKLDLFEGFTQKIVEMVQASDYASDTAIFITFDEGGGYYDSGYVQPLDFFGDGPRIPLIVVSPFAKKGYISHVYADHVSLDKFIERNWALPPISHRSRDNFLNPIALPGNPYVPINSPAIGDLFDFFDFLSLPPGLL